MNYFTAISFLIVSIATSTFAQEIIFFEDKGKNRITKKGSSKSLSKYSGYILQFPLDSNGKYVTLEFISREGNLISISPDVGIKLNELVLCLKRFQCTKSDLLVSRVFSESKRSHAMQVFFADKHLRISKTEMSFTYNGEVYYLNTRYNSLKINFYNDPDEVGNEVYALGNYTLDKKYSPKQIIRVNNRSKAHFNDIALLKNRPEYKQMMEIAIGVLKEGRSLTNLEYQFFRGITYEKYGNNRYMADLFEYPFYEGVSDKKCQSIYKKAMSLSFFAPMKKLASQETIFNCNFKYFTAELLLKMDNATFPFVRVRPDSKGVVHFCYTKDHYRNVVKAVSKEAFSVNDYFVDVKHKSVAYLKYSFNKCIVYRKDSGKFLLDFHTYFTE